MVISPGNPYNEATPVVFELCIVSVGHCDGTKRDPGDHERHDIHDRGQVPQHFEQKVDGHAHKQKPVDSFV